MNAFSHHAQRIRAVACERLASGARAPVMQEKKTDPMPLPLVAPMTPVRKK